MDEFTKEEQQRINVLYGTDFKDATPDDFKLISRWERYKAVNDEKYQLEKQALEQVTQAKIELLTEKEKTAIDVLKTKKAIALARLEQVKHGQEKQE